MCIRGIPVPIYQDESELQQLRLRMQGLPHPARILEIGSLFGGTLWAWMQDAPGSFIVSVDTGVQSFDYRHEEVEAARRFWPVWAKTSGCDLTQIRVDSTAAATIAEVQANGPFDFIFIDGGHDYGTARSDFDNYWPMLKPGGLLAMHDIAYPDNNPDRYAVGQVWREVRTRGDWQEIIRDHNPEGIWGIGVIRKGEA